LLKALENEVTNHVAEAAKVGRNWNINCIQSFQRIHANTGDNDLLRSYGQEWKNFSVLIEYLPTPFAFIERGVQKTSTGISRQEGKNAESMNIIRNTMFTLWNQQVFEVRFLA
jgi:hypothetical protein